MGSKLGLEIPEESDSQLISHFLQFLASNSLDFTTSFRLLTQSIGSPESLTEWRSLAGFKRFYPRWLLRINRQTGGARAAFEIMKKANPVLIPRNHQIDRAIARASTGDYSAFGQMVDALKEPFSDDSKYSHLAKAPLACERIHHTFCGT
jgi:uncharacterized protein YdiU (UPF0061 family)